MLTSPLLIVPAILALPAAAVARAHFLKGRPRWSVVAGATPLIPAVVGLIAWAGGCNPRCRDPNDGWGDIMVGFAVVIVGFVALLILTFTAALAFQPAKPGSRWERRFGNR